MNMKGIRLIIVMLSAVMLNVNMLNVIMLIVMAPLLFLCNFLPKKINYLSQIKWRIHIFQKEIAGAYTFKLFTP